MAVLGRLIGESPGLVAVRSQVEQLLRRQSGSRRLPPVLILGETGTGKGLLATAIHDAGPRAAGPFVAVNCAAIPETLLEAELFGFEQGAFTDARHAKAGLFQTANRGTLFLDEIGLLPQSLQAKLLTVLEDRTVRRLGSTRSEPVDVWIISATSEDLKAGARRRGFREELYHRLAVVTLQLPALRERGQDIVLLAEHYLTRTCSDYGLPPKTLTEDARAALLAYPWPGNVRELANLMERVALLTDGRRVTADILELSASRGRAAARPRDDDVTPARAPTATSLEHAVGEVERARIVEALHETRGNISHAADRLGVTRNILRYRLKKYGLSAASGTAEPPIQAQPVSHPFGPPPVARAAHVRWERRHVALLRADLVSTPLVGGVSYTAGALETLVEKIESFGGQIEEMSPTELVAVFGLEPVEDASRRAAHAALAIQRAAARSPGRSAESPSVRIGLHAGEVLVAWVGSSARVDHAAKREAWRQLEAFMSGADAGTVLVSEATRSFLERRFVLSACVVDNNEMAGRVYRVLGLEQTGLGLGERLTPFVGRGRELEQFDRALEQVQGGHGQVVAVVGEAGVGKSRLSWEFIRSPRARDSLVLVGSAASYGKAMPYLPVIDLLKRYFKIEPRDDADSVKVRITEKMLSLGRGMAPAVPAVLALLDVPVDDAQWQALDPQQKRRRMLEAVKLPLLEEGRRRPVVLVFEDLHWIDSETQALLDTLVESLPSHRVLLLVTYRPEYQHSWGGKTYYAQLRLDPLSPESALVLLDSLLGRDEAMAALKAALIERTGGNPFFLEEIVQTLVEVGVLTGDREAYRFARPLGEIQVPVTVQAVLTARIERLSREDKTLLQTAAVIGKDVPVTLLQAIAEAPEDTLRRSLTNLQAAEFLYEMRLFPDLEYTFKHALTHEVAYGGMLHDRRRALHAQIAAAIETLYADRLSEHTEAVAHHAFRGEEWQKAVRYGREAGRKARAQWANWEATAYIEQALEALAHLPADGRTREMAVDLRLDLYPALLPLDRLRPLLDRLREAERLASDLGDRERLGWARLHITHVGGLLGDDLRPVVDLAHDVIALAHDLGIRRMEADAYQWAGCYTYALGEHRPAVNLLLKAIDARFDPEAGQPVRVVGRTGYVAMFLAELGAFAEAQRHVDLTLRTAETFARHPWNRVNACWQVAWAYALQGDLDRAKPLAEEAIELCRHWGYGRSLGICLCVLGRILALAGCASEAVPLLEEGLERTDAVGMTWLRLPRLVHLAEAYLHTGRLEEAATRASEAVAAARQRGERGFEAWALRLWAEIGRAGPPGDASIAENRYCEAMALATELEMRPLVAHCHFGLGKLYRRTGKRPEAAEHLAAATAMYREMDMRLWLEQVETER